MGTLDTFGTRIGAGAVLTMGMFAALSIMAWTAGCKGNAGADSAPPDTRNTDADVGPVLLVDGSSSVASGGLVVHACSKQHAVIVHYTSM